MSSKLKNIALSLTSGTLTGTDLMYLASSAGDVDAKATLDEIAGYISAFVAAGGTTAELIRDTIAAALVQAGILTVVNNDAGDTITISVTTEAVQDVIGALIAAATGVNGGVVVTYDDAGNIESIGLLSSAFFALTDAATIAWNMNDGYNAKVTLGGNRIIGTPTNPVEGRTYTLQLIQDGTGSRTITSWGVLDFGSAGNPTLSTGAGKKDFVFIQCIETAGPTFRASFNKSA